MDCPSGGVLVSDITLNVNVNVSAMNNSPSKEIIMQLGTYPEHRLICHPHTASLLIICKLEWVMMSNGFCLRQTAPCLWTREPCPGDLCFASSDYKAAEFAAKRGGCMQQSHNKLWHKPLESLRTYDDHPQAVLGLDYLWTSRPALTMACQQHSLAFAVGEWIEFNNSEAFAVPCRHQKRCEAVHGCISVATPPVPKLPTLTSQNEGDFPEWHRYYNTVFHERVINPVDLNTFNWFYWYSPLGNLSVSRLDAPHAFFYIPINTPWTGFQPFMPETLAGQYGFFVRREVRPRSSFLAATRLEVMHVCSPHLIEENIDWFYHTIGSGIFVPTMKPAIILDHRWDWSSRNWSMCTYWREDGTCFSPNRLKMVVFRDAWSFNSVGRTEVLFYRPVDQPSDCCPPHNFSTGASGQLPCECSHDSHVLSCAPHGTSRERYACFLQQLAILVFLPCILILVLSHRKPLLMLLY